MSTQSEALLSIVSAYIDLGEDARTQHWARLFGNPVICTPTVYDLALAESAEGAEREMLERMRQESLIVVTEDPAETRAQLSGRVGYENRAARRARRAGKGGKVK